MEAALMEAARALVDLPDQLRERRFARECEQLRPLGEAYVLRRFGGSLGRADAEDAVSEVLIRLHRRVAEGRRPDNLRAAFFTSVRNAAIDQLRARSARPTVALEAAADAPAEAAIPAEHAESREDAVRLQEALGRMRPNYREAILLRFGLGLTVPEIAARLGISLPAAKKLVLRATAQVRKRLAAIEGQEFCPQMRELARRSLFDKEAAGLAEESESRILHAHFQHCGSCRSFLASLHDDLQSLGAGALLAAKVGALGHLAHWAAVAGHGAQVGVGKVRFAAYKATGVLQPSDAGTAGAVAGGAQKIAAICTVGAASAATCLATGIVGPGIGVTTHSPVDHDSGPARVRAVSSASSAAEPMVSEPSAEAPPAAAPVTEASPPPPEPEPAPAQTPSQQTQTQFGIESEPEPAPEPEAPPPSPAPASSSSFSPSSSSGSGSSSASHAASKSFGFGG